MAGNINSAYAWAISTCNDPNVGYSQAYRNQQTVNGITYYDCSSFIWYALKAAGFPVGDGWPFVTQNMGSVLISLGFKEVPNSGEYKPGDIGVNPETHTEMCYQGGQGKGIRGEKRRGPPEDSGRQDQAEPGQAAAGGCRGNAGNALPGGMVPVYPQGAGAGCRGIRR